MKGARIVPRSSASCLSGLVGCALQSSQKLVYDLSGHIRQSKVAALESEGQLLVVDAEAVKHRGVQVVDVDTVFDDVISEIIGLSMDDPSLNAASRHPQAVAPRMMVSAETLLRNVTLTVSRSAEFSAPDNERVLQEAPLFEVGDQRRGGLVR